ncbi:Uncharacterised protein [Mycobacteroides abscessus subsp. abscessus]|nr:Uncharacterised protein [Mycobacteroides abscessus subsp. abscessus]
MPLAAPFVYFAAQLAGLPFGDSGAFAVTDLGLIAESSADSSPRGSGVFALGGLVNTLPGLGAEFLVLLEQFLLWDRNVRLA